MPSSSVSWFISRGTNGHQRFPELEIVERFMVLSLPSTSIGNWARPAWLPICMGCLSADHSKFGRQLLLGYSLQMAVICVSECRDLTWLKSCKAVSQVNLSMVTTWFSLVPSEVFHSKPSVPCPPPCISRLMSLVVCLPSHISSWLLDPRVISTKNHWPVGRVICWYFFWIMHGSMEFSFKPWIIQSFLGRWKLRYYQNVQPVVFEHDGAIQH